MRWCPPCETPSSTTALRSGRRGKRRRCSASGATSSRSSPCPGPTPPCAATGRSVAAARPRDERTPRRPRLLRVGEAHGFDDAVLALALVELLQRLVELRLVVRVGRVVRQVVHLREVVRQVVELDDAVGPDGVLVPAAARA